MSRRIERARIAAGIEKDPIVIEQIRKQTSKIKEAAAQSAIVASGAVKALKENDLDIEQAKRVDLAADLVADEVLTTRNFVGETLRAAWAALGPDLTFGTQVAARILRPLAVIALLTMLAGPVAGLAGIIRGDLFRPVRGAIDAVQKRRTAKQRAGRRDDPAP